MVWLCEQIGADSAEGRAAAILAGLQVPICCVKCTHGRGDLICVSFVSLCVSAVYGGNASDAHFIAVWRMEVMAIGCARPDRSV